MLCLAIKYWKKKLIVLQPLHWKLRAFIPHNIISNSLWYFIPIIKQYPYYTLCHLAPVATILIHLLCLQLWSRWTNNPILELSNTAMTSLIARFVGPTWSPSGADRTQVGPMLAPWTLLSGMFHLEGHVFYICLLLYLWSYMIQRKQFSL